MRYFLSVFIIAALFAGVGCKSDGDVLATYTGGEVTRGELYDWAGTRRMSKDTLIKKKVRQRLKLKQIVLDKLTIAEAKKSGFDKTPDYKRLISLVKNNFIVGYFRKANRKDVKFKEEAVDVSIIRLQIKDYKIVKNKRKKLSKSELEKVVKAKTELGKKIIAEYTKGTKFPQLVKKYSNDHTRRKEGRLGYISHGMREPELITAAMALKKGEITKEPLKIRSSIFIIKLEDKNTLTDENINDIIKNEKAAKRLTRRLQRKASKERESNLKKATDVVDNIEKVNFKKSDELIFKVGASEFKVSDFNDLLDFIYKRRKSQGRAKMAMDDKKKKSLSGKILMEKLIIRESEKANLLKEEKFLHDWKMFSGFTLAGAYKHEVISKKVTVLDDEIKGEYLKNKDRVYTKKNRVKGKVVKKVQPLSKVKDRIRSSLMNRKLTAKRRQWESTILKKNKFVVQEDQLLGE